MAINQIISNFNTVASQRDFARDNLFRIMSVKTRALELTEADLLYCKGANIPAREIPSGSVPFQGMEFHYPKSSVKYDGTYALTFLIDANGDIRKKVEEASRILFNDLSNTGNWRVPGTTDQIVLVQLGFNMEPIKTWTLYGVCLTKIDQVPVNFQGDGSHIEVTINFTYNYYKTEGSDIVYSE